MRVLIVKVSSMGDILDTLPALTDAMQAIPGINFDWVVEEDFAQIPNWHEAVDLVIPIAIRRWRKSWFSMSVKSERKKFHQIIQSKHYHAIIDAQGLLKSAVLITRLARGIKHGIDWKTANEPLSNLFYNRSHYINKEQHAVERNRDLFAKSLNYLKPQTQGNYAISQSIKNKITFNRSSYVLFLYATTRSDKCWPEEQWRKLIQFMQPTGIQIKLLWATQHDYHRAKRLSFGFTYVEILPKLSLIQVAKILANARAVISVDTGLSHLAAALDKHNITLFGPTNSRLIGGYGKNQYSVTSPTRKMIDITADEVFKIFQLHIFNMNN